MAGPTGPTPSWNLSRVHCLWYSQGAGSNLKPGTYKVTIPARITSVVDDSVVPAGVWDSGDLNVRAGSPSLDVLVPATDDPDILERGWKVIVEIKFADTSAVPEKYIIDVPVNGEVNLRGITPVGSSIPPMTSAIPIGAPGGFVLYDNNGDVRDAAGNLVAGGTGGTAGPVTTSSITDATTVGKSLLRATDAAAARATIQALPSSYTPTWVEVGNKPLLFPPDKSGFTKADVGLGNVDNTPDASKPISTATQGALNTKAPLSHKHTAADLSGVVKTVNGAAPDAAGNVAVAGGGNALNRVDYVRKFNGVWGPRPTDDPSILVMWVGADPSPAIVTSGTGGMLDGVDIRFVTP